MERIKLVGFCLHEALLSGIYVWETAKLLLHLCPESRNRFIVAQLLIMNVIGLIFDFAVVIVKYAGFYAVQVMFKPVAYSIKLKLEGWCRLRKAGTRQQMLRGLTICRALLQNDCRGSRWMCWGSRGTDWGRGRRLMRADLSRGAMQKPLDESTVAKSWESNGRCHLLRSLL
ncbi:hypothetical protein BDW69DRAFT_168327 [Aspergillus filifer]